jgi:hypothetical protein
MIDKKNLKKENTMPSAVKKVEEKRIEDINSSPKIGAVFKIKLIAKSLFPKSKKKKLLRLC